MASTLPTTPWRAPHPGADDARVRPAGPSVGPALLVALVGAAGYAAFAGGAVRLPEEAWLQAGVALLGLVAATAWLGSGTLRPGSSPPASAALVLLALFAAWTGLSLLWSVTPDRTWAELNRALAYTLVVAVALAAAADAPRAVERVAVGWLVVATAVALYALGGKVLPGVLDHARTVARLRAPLEYWNALGLVCVLGAPIALRIATARDVRPRRRLSALVALLLLICCAGLTYSRGALVALAVAVVVVTIAGGARLPGLAVVALASALAAPVLGFAWNDEVLSANGAPLAAQIDRGLVLLAVLAGAAVAIALAGWALLHVEARVRWSRARSARTWAILATVALALAAGGVTALALSDRGLRGTIGDAADTFTQPSRDPVLEPGRLLTAGSGNRWAWWREAAGAWSDEPVVGWGAGSFPVVRRLYRVSQRDVQRPHSMPLQFLSELGAAGAVLGLGAVLLLLTAGVLRVRALPAGRERDLAGALLAGGVAWTVHACFDWDWDIPGVTVPVLLFLGVLGARRRAVRPAPSPPPVTPDEPRPGRVLALALAALTTCAVVLSAVLPAWSDSRTDAALVAVSDGSPEALRRAAADAELAARLDPLAVRPLFAAAAVAERRGRLLEARARLLDAVDRQPWSLEAWSRLTRIAVGLADRSGVELASTRALALDPADPDRVRAASRVQGILAPPEASATATGTPLPPAPAP